MNSAALGSPASLIGQRRARSLAGARRRSKLVRMARLALALAIAAALTNVVVQIVFTADTAASAPAPELTGGERIVNPRFTGRDEAGRPFVVTARSAARRTEGLQALADLELPALDYALVDETAEDPSTVLARVGVFDETEQTLTLTEDVRLRTRSGYVFTAASARLHLGEGRVTGDDPVYGEAPWGALRAGRFEVEDQGRRIRLEGGVQTRLYLSDDAPDEENRR